MKDRFFYAKLYAIYLAIASVATVHATALDETGNLPVAVTLDTNSSAFFVNEIAQNIAYGAQISFDLNFTQNAPDSAGSLNASSFFLLDSNGKLLPVTTDPTGANSLLQFNIDGLESGALNVYTALDTNNLITWTVTPPVAPISTNLWSFVTGLIGLRVDAGNKT